MTVYCQFKIRKQVLQYDYIVLLYQQRYYFIGAGLVDLHHITGQLLHRGILAQFRIYPFFLYLETFNCYRFSLQTGKILTVKKAGKYGGWMNTCIDTTCFIQQETTEVLPEISKSEINSSGVVH